MSGQRNEGDFIVLEKMATFNAMGPKLYSELSGTLRQNQQSMGSAEVLVQTLNTRNGQLNEELSGALQAPKHGVSLNSVNPVFDGVRLRRFTPKEVCRLQGFPDDWCEGFSDSFIYSAMGDSIALPVSEWILRRIAAYERRNTDRP